MTVQSTKEIKAFRGKVPVVSHNDDIVFLNASFQPPSNTIVADSLSSYVSKALYDINPKLGFINECEETRKKVGKFINTSPENVAFTRDTTEGLNLFQRSVKWSKGDNVVILDGEHPNQGFGWLGLESEGLEIKLIKTDESQVKPYSVEDFAPYVDEHTRAIGISSVMFHSGLRNNVKALSQEFKPKGIHILVDATQEVGFGKLDVHDLGVSAVAFGVHKGLSVPTGLGVLYVDPEVIPSLKEVPPFLCAGSISNLYSNLTIRKDFEVHPNATRYDHLNKGLMQCIALGKYLDFLEEVGIENVQTYIEELGSYLRSKLRSIGVKTLGPDAPSSRSPQSNIIPLTDPSWADFFKENNVYISQYRCGVRISLGLYNNQSDIDRFVTIVEKGLKSGLQISK